MEWDVLQHWTAFEAVHRPASEATVQVYLCICVSLAHQTVMQRLLLHNSPARETMHTGGIEWTNCQHVTGEITVYIRVITTI